MGRSSSSVGLLLANRVSYRVEAAATFARSRFRDARISGGVFALYGGVRGGGSGGHAGTRWDSSDPSGAARWGRRLQQTVLPGARRSPLRSRRAGARMVGIWNARRMKRDGNRSRWGFSLGLVAGAWLSRAVSGNCLGGRHPLRFQVFSSRLRAWNKAGGPSANVNHCACSRIVPTPGGRQILGGRLVDNGNLRVGRAGAHPSGIAIARQGVEHRRKCMSAHALDG